MVSRTLHWELESSFFFVRLKVCSNKILDKNVICIVFAWSSFGFEVILIQNKLQWIYVWANTHMWVLSSFPSETIRNIPFNVILYFVTFFVNFFSKRPVMTMLFWLKHICIVFITTWSTIFLYSFYFFLTTSVVNIFERHLIPKEYSFSCKYKNTRNALTWNKKSWFRDVTLPFQLDECFQIPDNIWILCLFLGDRTWVFIVVHVNVWYMWYM